METKKNCDKITLFQLGDAVQQIRLNYLLLLLHCMKELKLQYGSEETSISLLVDMSVGIGGDKWPAADQFCSLISDPKWTPFFHGLFDGKRVIELGSGNGLAGILASKLYHPDEVIISDLASHIPLIAQNIKLNECLNCIALEFDWFSPPTLPLFDIIMAFEW